MFHFKKFSIDDRKAAMKIGTDAVLLGAWVNCKDQERILDIGTGTGILALMIAQQSPGIPVDAIEIEQEAAELARQNILLSPWTDQVQVFTSSIQDFSKQNSHLYSLVICNPPFFTDSLKSPSVIRNLARHNDILPLNELLEISSHLITPDGKAAFIFPYDALEIWEQEAAKVALFPVRQTFVKSTPLHKPHRVLITFAREKIAVAATNEICIYSQQKTYSDEYKDLTKDFYLTF